MAVERRSDRCRIAVESKSNRSCNQRVKYSNDEASG